MWDEGEEPHHQQLHRRFDNPTTAVQENGTYGGQGKAAGCVPLAALLSLNFSLFVLAITSQDIDSRSDVWASWACKADGFTSPIRPKDAKLRPRLPQRSGLSFLARLVLKVCSKHLCRSGKRGRSRKKHNSAFVKVRYSRGDRGTGEVPMFAHVRAEILFLAAGAILVVGVAYLF